MRNKKGILLVFALAVVVLLVVAGCASTTQTTSTPTPAPAPAPEPAKAEPGKVPNIVDDVKNSQHGKFFAFMMSKGPSVKDPQGDHYSDACLRCHSAVFMNDDKNAKVDDFLAGGKYANPDKLEGISCRVCHTFGGKDLMGLKNKGWDSCTVCHTASGITLGKEPHHSQKEMFEGPAVGSIPATPAYKFKNMKDSFSCVSCHITNSATHTFEVPGVKITYKANTNGTQREKTEMDWNVFKKEVLGQQQCQGCHAGNADQIVQKLKQSQEDTEKRMKALEPVYEEWSKKAATITDKNDAKLKAFQQFSTYYGFVESDASKGAHNAPYVKALLDEAEKAAAQLK